eukprot:3988249-Prymnesium_polylepis.1
MAVAHCTAFYARLLTHLAPALTMLTATTATLVAVMLHGVADSDAEQRYYADGQLSTIGWVNNRFAAQPTDDALRDNPFFHICAPRDSASRTQSFHARTALQSTHTASHSVSHSLPPRRPESAATGVCVALAGAIAVAVQCSALFAVPLLLLVGRKAKPDSPAAAATATASGGAAPPPATTAGAATKASVEPYRCVPSARTARGVLA